MSRTDKTRSKLHKLFEFTESRELLIEALQYSCKLIAYFGPDQGPKVARIYRSLSEGRKVFRLFKFVPELALIDANDLLASLKHLLAGSFYLLDHWVWLEQVVLQRKNLETWKFLKHKISLLASTFGLLDEPQPVRGADLNYDGKVTAAEQDKAAARRFAFLDPEATGQLALPALQSMLTARQAPPASFGRFFRRRPD